MCSCKRELITPCFVLDELNLRTYVGSIMSVFQSVWPNTLVAYSVKTNNWGAILRRLNSWGVAAEVVSAYEYSLAKENGFLAKDCICNGVAKTREWIKLALEEGALLHLDSLDEVDRLVEIVGKRESVSFGVRINATEPDFPAEPCGGRLNSRFGLSYRDGDIKTLKNILDEHPNMKLRAIHLHCNTCGRKVEGYVWLVHFFSRIVKEFHFDSIDTFDIGGSFGHDFDNPQSGRWPDWTEYASEISNALRQEKFRPDTLRLIIEPGVALIGGAINYYTRVVGERTFNGVRMLQLDGSRLHIDPHVSRPSFAGFVRLCDQGKNVRYPMEAIYAAGSTCIEKDRINLEGTGCGYARRGDLLCFAKVGAYSYALSPCSFINQPPRIFVKTSKKELVDG